MQHSWFHRGLLVGLLALSPVVAGAVDQGATATRASITVGIAFCEGYDAAATDQIAAFDGWKARLGVTTTTAVPTTGQTSTAEATDASHSAVYNLPPSADVHAIVNAVASDVQNYVVLKDNASQIRYVPVLKGYIVCPEGTYYPDPVTTPAATTNTTTN